MSTPLAQSIQTRMDELGLNAHSLARKAGVTYDAVRNILRGLSINPRIDTIQKIEQALGASLHDASGFVPVTGIIGRSGEIMHYEEPSSRSISMPTLPPTASCAMIEDGGLFGLIPSGSYLFFDQEPLASPDEVMGKLCVVILERGNMLIRRIQRGYTSGRYNLLGVHGDLQEDVAIESAHRILCILPA